MAKTSPTPLPRNVSRGTHRPGLVLCLLLSTAASGLATHRAHAQSTPTPQPTPHHRKHVRQAPPAKASAHHAAASHAASRSAHAAPRPSAPVIETVAVVAHHAQSHGTQEVVSREQMDRFVAGSSPMQILALTTPGANFSSSDALGLDTVADTLYVRGFNQSQLGMSLDGIPMGGQGFHNWNGLSIDQLEIQENISGFAMSQGAGALDVPSAQTLGGAITYTSSDPEDHFGGKISQMFGSYNGFRTFVRLDSGILNPTGTKFYVSYARTAQDLWKGFGYQNEQQANAKLVQPFSNGRGKITAVFDYSGFNQYNYLSLTKNMWRLLGPNTTEFKPNYALAKEYAIAAQNGTIPAGLPAGITPDEVGDLYYDAGQIQRNYLSAITGEYKINPFIDSRTIAYGHVSNGVYQGTNNFLTSPTSGVPMADQAGHPDVRRIGFTQNFTVRLHNNEIQTGAWYENDRMRYPTRLYEDGVNAAHPTISDYKASEATTWWEDSFNTNTFQYFLQDNWHITKDMTLLGGFRSMIQTTHGGTKDDYTSALASSWGTYYAHPANGSLTASDAFLPHFSWDWHFARHHELYADIAENMRAYDFGSQSGSGNAWGGLGTATNTAQSVFNASKQTLKPERTWNYVAGYRFDSRLFSGSVDYYHTDFINRLAAITSGTANNTYAAFINVGHETMDGADVQGTIRPFKGFELTNSFSWNDARYEDSALPIGGTTVDIKGNHQVYYPKFMYKVDLNYAYRGVAFNFNATWNDSRPMTYTNDEWIPAYWTTNLSASYDFVNVPHTHDVKVSFGITNIANTNYIGGVYGAASVSGDDNPNLFVASPREFFGTVAASF